MGNSSGSEISNLLLFLDIEVAELLLLLIILLRDDAISAAPFRLVLRDNEVGVVHLLLPCLDRGLVLGFGVFDLLLSILVINLGLQMSSSTLLFSL